MIPALNSWNIDSHQLLTQNEVDRVLEALRTKAKTSKCAKGNLILFRLLNTLGLRISEALGIRMDCIRLGNENPYVIVPKDVAKLGKARIVPIWSAQAIEEIKEFKELRRSMGAKDSDTFFCSLSEGKHKGMPITRQVAGTRYKTMMKMALSEERAKELHPHSSRHTFISACISRGVSLVETQRAAGHVNLATTSLYSHLYVDRTTKTYNLD